jgi:predicted nucleic acid-binding protein
MARFPAFLDTCSIFPAYLCDTLLRIAEAGAYRPLWSIGVLAELERNLPERGLSAEAVTHRVTEMRRAFPDAEVSGYEDIVDTMTCDPKDRHVLAAAVRSGAEVLVTFNTSDFPVESTGDYDIEVVHPDSFLLDQLDLYPGITVAALREQAGSYNSPAMTVEDCSGGWPPQECPSSPPRHVGIWSPAPHPEGAASSGAPSLQAPIGYGSLPPQSVACLGRRRALGL